MSETDVTNPETGVAGQEAPAPDEIDTEAFDRQPAPDDDDDPEPDADKAEGEGDDDPDKPAADEDLEEIEHDGQKFRVPKAVRPLLMLQADYTRKTQEVAEQRRAFEEQATSFEAERVQKLESLEAHRAEHIRIGVIERNIEAARAELNAPLDSSGLTLDNINWPNFARAAKDDPELTALYREYSSRYDAALRGISSSERELEKAKTDLSTKEAERLSGAAKKAEADLAKRREETRVVLKAEVPGWNTEAAAKTIEFANTHLGITPEEMGDATDPRLWKALHGLRTALAENASLKKAQKQQQTADNHGKAQATTPAVTPKGNGATPRDPSSPRGDDLGTETWMERRNRQVAARGR